MALPKFLQPYLASYDISLLDKESPAVKKELFTQVLNSGDDQTTRWLFKNYSLEEIKSAVRSPQRGAWFKNSLNYWSKIFGIDIPSSQHRKAILDLFPKK